MLKIFRNFEFFKARVQDQFQAYDFMEAFWILPSYLAEWSTKHPLFNSTSPWPPQQQDAKSGPFLERSYDIEIKYQG